MVFLTHGEKEIAIGFASNIRSELNLEVKVPEMNEVFELK